MLMKRKIGHVANVEIAFFLQNLDGGGAERAIAGLAVEIAKLEYAVHLVLGDANTVYNSEVTKEVKVIDFITRSPLMTFVRLMMYLHQKKPSVIMSALDTPNLMLLMAAFLVRFKGRVVISQRAAILASLSHESLLRAFLTKFLQNLLFVRADNLISNSYAASEEVKSLFGVPDEKVTVIHNAIDLDRIHRLASEPLINDFYTKSRVPLILSVGSLTMRKDVSTLIKAVAIVRAIRPVRLALIGDELVQGDGSEKERLRQLTVNLGLFDHVLFAGFDPNPYKWMSAAAVFVSSSTAEGFPNVIAEALAVGCPVVATDCPGDTAKLLEDGRWGRLVPVGNPESMATAILEALDDPSPSDGLMRAANFSPSKIVREYLQVLIPQSIYDDNSRVSDR